MGRGETDVDGVSTCSISRQRIRNRVFIALVAIAAILEAAIVVLIVAAATRSRAGAVAAAVVVAVAVLVSVVEATSSAAPPRRRSRRAADGDMLQRAAARVAGQLGMPPPAVWILDDAAVNAFSAGSKGTAQVVFTEGFRRQFSGSGDEPLVAAVTAHLLVRATAGDNRVAVLSNGLLNWAVFLFKHVVLRLAGMLGSFGKGYLTSDAHLHLKPADNVYGDDGVNRFIVWMISVAIGLFLLAASVAVFVFGGILYLIARSVQLGLARQRLLSADAIAALLTGEPAVLADALGRFDGCDVELASSQQIIQDLCFAWPSRFVPSLPARAACLAISEQESSPGVLAPVAGALAMAAVVAGAVLLMARIPFGPQAYAGGSSLTSAALPAQASPAATVPATGVTPGTAATPAGQASVRGDTPAATPTSAEPTAPTGHSRARARQATPTPAPPPAPSPSPKTTITVVVTSTGWTDAGVQLHQGDHVTISASGSWTADGVNYAGPDGYSSQGPDNFFNTQDIGACAYCATTPAPHWGALIGYAGTLPPAMGSYTSTDVTSQAGQIILVGSHYNSTSAQSGELWLGFNDDAYSDYTSDNAGQVTATVTVTQEG